MLPVDTLIAFVVTVILAGVMIVFRSVREVLK
jgi:hypothetical protein